MTSTATGIASGDVADNLVRYRAVDAVGHDTGRRAEPLAVVSRARLVLLDLEDSAKKKLGSVASHESTTSHRLAIAVGPVHWPHVALVDDVVQNSLVDCYVVALEVEDGNRAEAPWLVVDVKMNVVVVEQMLEIHDHSLGVGLDPLFGQDVGAEEVAVIVNEGLLCVREVDVVGVRRVRVDDPTLDVSH